MNLTFGKKLLVGFTLAAIALLLLAWLGYTSTSRLVENERWVAHTHAVRRDLADLLSYAKDAETSQRGYVITGNEAFLEPHQAALPNIDRVYNDLRKLTSDSQEQQRRLDSLRPLIDAKLAELKATIDMRRAQGFEPTQKIVTGGEGKKVMDQIRRVLEEMDRHELDLLEKRSALSDASADMTKQVLLWGTVVGLALIGFAGLWITRSLTTQVAGAVQHIQSSSAELQSAANQQATGAREQSTAMTEISTTISELLATSRQIAESAQRVAQVAGQTATSAHSGATMVERGQESASSMRKQVELIVSHMVELGKKSQQIGSVLDIVSELSEQTNILAINATIEAAGAGDAGKRFAVVADEIRKLADRVGGSTKEVRILIDDVRSAVNTTVMTTETGSKSVEANARSFNDVAASFRQIVQSVSTATEAAKEIELSTKQQSTAVEQVNVAITNVAQGTKETEVSTTQTLRTASELATLSRRLLEIVQSQSAN